MELVQGLGGTPNGEISFRINGQLFSFTENDTLDTVMNDINSNTGANVTISFDEAADQFVIKSNSTVNGTKVILENETGRAFNEGGLFEIAAGETKNQTAITRDGDSIATAAAKMGINLQLDESGNFSFTIKGPYNSETGQYVSKDFSFNPDTTSLQKMIDTVNADTDLNVKMTYSQITDSFVFTSGDTGSEATFELVNKDGVNAFGGADSFFGIAANQRATGSNAVVMIDGERIEKSSNSFMLDGISITLNMSFEAVEGSDDELSFSVTQDVDGVVDKVKKFVEEYNSLIASLNDLLKEEIDYDYAPLTEEERSAMSDSEIEKWETEAKKGILRNDSTLSGLLSEMRMSLYEKVGETGLSPADIGLTTGAWYNNGQISFDEDVFREALKSNPDAVAQVMAATSTSTDATTKNANSGIVSRFFNQMTAFENTLTKTNIQNVDDAIAKNEYRMDELLAKMYELEEKYYMQFSQMETLMTKYQSQSDWLTQQLSAL